MNLIEVARENPNIIVSVKVGDLIQANTVLIAELKGQIEKDIAKRQEVTYLTREMVMSKLNVVPSTLWRWQKKGYLIPISVGGQNRYRSTDIDEILEGKRDGK
jgi:hypothetical protein